MIVEGDDLYGDGVNIAARLETAAPAGGILVSRTVHEAVTGRLKATFADLGNLALKNIDRPVQAFSVKWEPSDWRRPSSPALEPSYEQRQPSSVERLALPDKPSIAVLPFQNFSVDPEQEYFADGIVEDIITALSRFRSLFVIARNSSFAYKGRSPDIRQVGRELGVRYVLEGSVRKAASTVRITSQLINSENGAHIWADRLDGALENIFELQDRVTENVVGAIAPQLERAEIERARQKPTDSLDAYDHYLRGMTNLHRGTRELIDEALARFNRALQLDPNFASTHAMAAWCHVWRKVNGWVTDRPREIAEGARLARRAVELGGDDAVALTRGGHAVAHFTGDVDGGIALIDRALVLNQNLGVRLVPRRIPESLERRTGRRHRVLCTGDAFEPSRPRDVSHAGGNGGGASVRRALRHRVFMGGEVDQAVAELPDGRRRHRSEPCACRPNRRSAACDQPFAPARSHAPHLQSWGLDSPSADRRISRRSPMACDEQGCRNDDTVPARAESDQMEPRAVLRDGPSSSALAARRSGVSNPSVKRS